MTKQGLRDLNNYGPKKEKGAPRNPVEEGVADVATTGEVTTDAATTDAAMPSPAPVVGLA